MVSKTMDDLPDPDTPVKIVILRFGMRNDIFFRLFSRAPRIVIYSWDIIRSLSSFTLVLPDPCGRGGVREHRRERTRTGGTEPTRHPPPEVVQVSAGRDGAVHPPWIPRNRPRAARAGALTRSAAAYEAGARSLQPTVVTRPAGSRSRGGSAPQ